LIVNAFPRVSEAGFRPTGTFTVPFIVAEWFGSLQWYGKVPAAGKTMSYLMRLGGAYPESKKLSPELSVAEWSLVPRNPHETLSPRLSTRTFAGPKESWNTPT